MIVKVDKVGRLVLPKRVREQLGLERGGHVEVSLDGATIRLTVPSSPTRQVEVVDDWPVLSPVSGSRLDDADIRELRDEQK